MQDSNSFYQERLTTLNRELSQLKKRLTLLGTIRLFIFIATVFCIYLFFNQTNLVIITSIIGVIIFLMVVKIHEDLKQKRRFTEKLITINQLEINVTQGNLDTLATGEEFIDQNHFYSFDIDLFGKGSFFQYCNRTITTQGKQLLAQWLTQNQIKNITQKQEAIQELAAQPKWRQEFSAKAMLLDVEFSTSKITHWIHHYKSDFSKTTKTLPKIFAIISLALFALTALKLVASTVLIIWFILGLVLSGFYLKKINKVYQIASKSKDTFKQYHQLLAQIETTSFKAQHLYEQQQLIKTDTQQASQIFLKFSKILDAFDQRNNLIMALLGNGLFLRDLQQVNRIEDWILKYHTKVEHWFKVVAYFDAQNSLANYAYNHSKTVYPQIKQEKNVLLQAEQLGHPLLKETQRISNNFSIDPQNFFIITGANMAGKSTFLRTVSLSIIMANMGLPVCAKKMIYKPIKLITSMRATDSLTDDTSYFFSELKRLKFIVDQIQEEQYFIILDEILKGTNSTDKAIGSKKFIEKLVSTNSTGIIATHDLSLCEIEATLPQVKNYYFDAEIVNNELYFDYRLKTGVCQNMNASFLLKKMQIIED